MHFHFGNHAESSSFFGRLSGLCGIAFTCLLLPSLLAAADPPAGYSRVGSAEQVTEYRLESNGLQVLVLPDRSAPAVTFMVTFRVGSRNESYGTTGATHLLEHLMFKGTPLHNREQGNGYDQLIERTGAMSNATTSLDRTNYYATLSSEHLPLAIELEADRMRNLRLREEDRRPEMTVVRNEFEQGENDPAETLDKELWSTAFLAHPYHHNTIGWRSDVESVPIEKLRQFYDVYYWPNNATVSILGDVDVEQALALVRQHFGSIPSSPHAIPEVTTQEPPQTGPRRVTVLRPGELGVVSVVHKIPPARHPDYAALRVLSIILSEGRNSRFYQALTDKSLTVDVSAYPHFNRDPSLFSISAQLAPDVSHSQVEETVLSELKRVQDAGVTADELASALARFAASTAYSRDGSFAIAQILNECIAVGDWRLYYDLDRQIQQVSAADVQRVAQTYFIADHRVTGWFIPQNEVPQRPSLDLPPPADESTHAQPAAATPSAALEVAPAGPASSPAASSPATGSGEATTANATTAEATTAEVRSTESTSAKAASTGAPATAALIAPRITRVEAVGVDLLICPTEVQNVVTITGAIPLFPDQSLLVGEMIAGMLSRGTQKHSANEIAAILDQVGATIRFGYSAGTLRFSARCLSQDTERTIKLLAEQLRTPSFPADEFDKLKRLKSAAAQQMREESDVQAGIALRQAVYPVGHPLRRLSSPEILQALEALSLEELRQAHQAWLGPQHATVVVVGDLDPALIQAQFAAAFGGWSGGQSLNPPAAAVAQSPARTELLPIAGKESVSVIWGTSTGLSPTAPDYLPLSVATAVLGEGFTSRLVGQIRDTEGLTYGIAAGLSGAERFDPLWLIFADFAPSLLTQGVQSTQRELQRWVQEGITPEELTYRQSALAGAHRVGLATSSGLAETILGTVRQGYELSWIDEYPAKVAALQLDAVNGVIRRYVKPDQLIMIQAGALSQLSTE